MARRGTRDTLLSVAALVIFSVAACCSHLVMRPGFSLPQVSRRGLIGASLLGGAMPASAKEHPIAVLNVDVVGNDGPQTELVKIRLRSDWAPKGVNRFIQLAELDHLTDSAFFDVDKADVARFGPTPPLKPIKGEATGTSNLRGTVSFGTSPQSGRVDELQIEYKGLNRQGVLPFGEVIEGMDVIERLYDGYGASPDKSELARSGNEYLDKAFPKSPKIKSVEIWEPI